MDARFPEGTLVQAVWAPTIRAQVALDHRGSEKATELLRSATRFELAVFGGEPQGLWSIIVRGNAYLAEKQGREAAAEFQKILDDRALAGSEPFLVPVAHLQLARAYGLEAASAQSADAVAARAKARDAYEDFLTLWKDGRPRHPHPEASQGGVREDPAQHGRESSQTPMSKR